MSYTLHDLMPGNTVTILANGASKVMLPPNPECVWAQGFMKRFLDSRGVIPHAWVDIHRPEIFTEEKPWGFDWLEVMKTTDRPVIMFQRHSNIPNSVGLPTEMTAYRYTGLHNTSDAEGNFAAPFAGTLDWMLALACFLGAKRVYLYGTEYITLHERLHQTFGLAYWVGFARGLGIDVVLPHNSKLLWNIMPGRYGPEYPPWKPVHDPRIEYYRNNSLRVFTEKSLDRQSAFAEPEIRFVRKESAEETAKAEGPQQPMEVIKA